MKTFVEIGANDGSIETNIVKELDKENKVILIEANPVVYKKCCENRPDALVFNFACVSDSSIKEVEFCASLDNMSQTTKDHLQITGEPGAKDVIKVPCKTMQEILDECEVSSVDFMCVDVEGAEAQILKGISSNTFIHNMMVEVHYPDSFGHIQSPDSETDIVNEAKRLQLELKKKRFIAPASPGLSGKGRSHFYFANEGIKNDSDIWRYFS